MAEEKTLPVAREIYRGHIEEPTVQPGMIARYEWDDSQGVGENDLSPPRREALQKLQETRTSLYEEYKRSKLSESSSTAVYVHHRSTYVIKSAIEDVDREISELLSRKVRVHTDALVTKVILQDDEWHVHLEGFRRPVSPKQIFPMNWSEMPKITSSESYELQVLQDPNILDKMLAVFGKQRSPKRTIARVLTQSALAEDSIVYMQDAASDSVYVVRASDLQSHQKSRPRRGVWRPPSYTSTTSTERDDTREDDSGKSTSTPIKTNYLNPIEISEDLSKVVRNQEVAVRSMSVAAYDHLVRPEGIKKSNTLIIGRTGTGKTELSRQVSELLGVPFAEAKLAGYSSTGYKGTNLESVFEDLFPHKNNPNFARSVIFLDEIDKLGERITPDSGGFGTALQNALIGWVESAQVKVPRGVSSYFDVDTTNMLFIGAGAFVGLEDTIAQRMGLGKNTLGFHASGREESKVIPPEELYGNIIHEDLVRYGIKPELVARFPVLTYTRPLNRDALIDIMKNGSKSAFNQQIRLLQEGYGIAVDVDEQTYVTLADAALRLGIGARGLETVCNRLFEGLKYDIGNRTSLTISGSVAYDKLKALLPENYKS